WGPIRIFRNDHGKLTPWDPPVTFSPQLETRNAERGTLSQLTGWWNGVTTGDLDGDGRLDIVASNWGRNTKYQSYRQQAPRIYYGEWRAQGMLDSMEAYYDRQMKNFVPWCTFAVAQALPWITERFQTQE